MVEFRAKNSDLIRFITRCNCNGTITISKTEKINDNFFTNYFLEAGDNMLEVKAIDSQAGTTWIWHKLNGVTVNEKGKFAVTNSPLILSLLKSIPPSREVAFSYKSGESLTIMTVDSGPFKGFEVREEFTLSPDDLKIYNSDVLDFIDLHSFSDVGIPVIGDDPKVGLYSTIIYFSKEELGGVIKQSIDLTQDQNIRFTMDAEGNVAFNTTKANSSIKANDKFENKVSENPIAFSQEFSTLQPIVNHLFDSITVFLRKATDEKIKLWIRTKSGNIELNFVTGAV